MCKFNKKKAQKYGKINFLFIRNSLGVNSGRCVFFWWRVKFWGKRLRARVWNVIKFQIHSQSWQFVHLHQSCGGRVTINGMRFDTWRCRVFLASSSANARLPPPLHPQRSDSNSEREIRRSDEKVDGRKTNQSSTSAEWDMKSSREVGGRFNPMRRRGLLAATVVFISICNIHHQLLDARTSLLGLLSLKTFHHEKWDTYDVLSSDTFALFSFLFAITLIAFTYDFWRPFPAQKKKKTFSA